MPCLGVEIRTDHLVSCIDILGHLLANYLPLVSIRYILYMIPQHLFNHLLTEFDKFSL